MAVKCQITFLLKADKSMVYAVKKKKTKLGAFVLFVNCI